jgi:hypothetical protein
VIDALLDRFVGRPCFSPQHDFAQGEDRGNARGERLAVRPVDSEQEYAGHDLNDGCCTQSFSLGSGLTQHAGSF